MRRENEGAWGAGGAMKIRFLPLILLCLLLGGCGRAVSEGCLVSAAEGSGEYCAALCPFLPGYAVREAEESLYAEAARGGAVACFDVQAVPAMRRAASMCRRSRP